MTCVRLFIKYTESWPDGSITRLRFTLTDQGQHSGDSGLRLMQNLGNLIKNEELRSVIDSVSCGKEQDPC